MRCVRTALAAFVIEAGALALGSGSTAEPQESFEVLASKLKEPDEEVRRGAVDGLAALNSPAAWALVVDALGDRSPLVADEAQLRLGSVADATAWKCVAGKSGLGSKDPIVQQRVVEAIGRMTFEVDGRALAKALSARDADMRRIAARAIERLAVAHQLDKKSKSFLIQQLGQVIASDKDPLVRAAAIPARQAIEPYTVSDLFEMLSKKDDGVVRAAATRSMAVVEFGQIPGLYNSTLEEEEPCAVRALVDVLYRNGSGISADSIAVILKRYPARLRLQWQIIDRLRELTGKFDELGREFWILWRSGLGGAGKPAQPPDPMKYATRADLLGMPVITDRLTILIDVTGWPEEKGADGMTLRAQVRSEIERMLGQLPEGSEFNLVPYAGSPQPWEKALVSANPANVKRALKSFDGCTARGDDDFLEAAATALSDADVDTILVITDTAPAGRMHRHPDLVLEELTQRNRYQTVVIDAVLIHPDASLEARWKEICAPSGGRVAKASF